ncbi:transmembrane protein 59 isoform X1 [Bufo gargarizans]|uniref:transmembrane protein 59 isoform X1 n=1 Tax=Bufo gargarizans TaxID=30331 RepID=UPI001CF579D9|nr:transmembrane protein 59 isoform X1 [Bufo gargarizans]
MATVRLFCGLALLLCCTLGVRGSLDTALGDSSSCHQVCEGTYPLHTYPEEEELFACHRGCRLFSICQFAEEGDLNKTKTECESACIEAYPQSNEQYACILGCHSQMPFAEKRQDELSDMVPRIHILFPLTIVKAFWSDMMDSAQSFMTSSWTFYIQADNGHILVVQSQPEIQQMPPLEPEDLSPRGNMLDAVPSDLGNGHSVGEGLWSRRASILELDGGEGIMKCFSMNSNWLLTATLLLSILVLLWICCATVATASDQYIPSEKLSIYGDLEYLNEQKLYKYPPASLVVVHGLPQENEDAGPLPTKVDLAKSDI